MRKIKTRGRGCGFIRIRLVHLTVDNQPGRCLAKSQIVLLFHPLVGGGTIYSTGCFFFSQFWPIDIFIVES